MNNSISLLRIVHDTTVDGPGFRTSIYAAGCKHQCPGCHNPHSWDITNGVFYSIENILDEIKKAEFANVTFSGGDPLFQAKQFTKLSCRIKTETRKNIWCYTGFTYEQVKKSKKLLPILSYIDVLVDGRYMEDLHDESLPFRGSSNQRIIDVPKSLEKGDVVIWESGI